MALPDFLSAGLGGGFAASLAADSLLNGANNVWRIFKTETGATAIEFSSFISCDVRDEAAIVDGPVEEGSFASYNKVKKPLEIKASIAVMGDESKLQESLYTLEDLVKGTELVSLVTPSTEYDDLNLESYNYTLKRENGRGVLFIDLSLKEVKQVKMAVSNEKIPVRKERGKVQEKNKSLISMGKNSETGRSMTDFFVGSKK